MLKKIQTWIDQITTAAASVLLLIMFVVLIVNVVLRLIPSVGGAKWASELSQFLNVWAMLIGSAGIAVRCTNLRVEAVDNLMCKIPAGEKISRVLIDLFLIAFYIILAVSGKTLAEKSVVRSIATMPKYSMALVYSIFPIAGVLCALSALVHLLVTLTDKDGASGAENAEGGIAQADDGKEAAE